MTTYAFETITPEQALNIQVGDYLTFAGGPASRVSVSYSPNDLPLPGRIVVSFEGRTVAFGEQLADLSQRGAIDLGDQSRLLIGDADGDLLTGSARNDGLYGGDGDDVARGGDGDDLLQGNQGNDTLHGEAGVNTVYGGRGDDVIYASTFRSQGSWAHGNQGNDEVIGGSGADTLYGGQGDDFIGGSDGDDILNGDLGDDEIIAGAGDDLAFGGAGNDKLSSSDGDDVLLGGDGDDQIVAYGFGEAWMEGGAGNDTLVAATQQAALIYGGDGRDRFEFVAKFGPSEGHDHVIVDWEASDQISFAQVSVYSILPRSYSEFVADDYKQALTIANEHIRYTGAHYVAAQVGPSVYVFADTDGDSSNGADIGLMLVDTTLADIGLGNFV